jgi:hypothetical protein
MTHEEAKQLYRGVLCFYCHQPIPISATAAHREKKLRLTEMNPTRELGSCVFTLRCRACEREGVYAGANFKDFEGTPRVRTRRPRPSSPLPGPQHGFPRSANS